MDSGKQGIVYRNYSKERNTATGAASCDKARRITSARRSNQENIEVESHSEEVQQEQVCNVIRNSSDDEENVEPKTRETSSGLVSDTAIELDANRGDSCRKMNWKQIMILISIYIAYFLTWLNLSLQAPLFPKKANEKGVSVTITGWIFGVNALIQFIVSPFYRRLLPILDCRSLLMLGVFLCGGGTISFGLLSYIDTTNSKVLFVVSCFLVRILLAISCVLIDNTGLVMLTQLFPNKVATLMGIGEIFTGGGLIIGPVLGALLYAKGGYILPFAVSGGMTMLALPLYWLSIPRKNLNLEDDSSDLPMSKLLLHPVSIVNSVVIVLSMIAWSVLDPTLEPHLREHGLRPETVAIMFLVMAAFYSVTCPIWGRTVDVITEKRILTITGTLLIAIGFILIGPSPMFGLSMKYDYVWYTAISLGIIGTAGGMCVISTYSVYINVLTAIDFPQNGKSYGMVSGLWVSMYSLGYFIGPSIGGLLLDHIGFEWLSTVVAMTCLVTCLMVCLRLIGERQCCKNSRTYRLPAGVTDDRGELAYGAIKITLGSYLNQVMKMYNKKIRNAELQRQKQR